MNWIRTEHRTMTIFEGVNYGPKATSSNVFDIELEGKGKVQARKILESRFGCVNRIGNKFFCKGNKS